MSESETKGRCRRDIDKCLSRNDLFDSQAMLADAIDRIAADVAEIKAKVDSVEPEDNGTFIPSELEWNELVDCKNAAIRERDEARAEFRRLLGELAEAKAETQRIQDEADDREQTEKVKRLNAEIEKTHRSLLNRTWERDIATAEVERLRQSWVLTNALARACSPPVVEVPALKFLGSMTGREQGIVQAYRDALDRAGVAWMEAKRE